MNTVALNATTAAAGITMVGDKQYMMDGMFGGNRVHDLNDSQHPVFRFSRQDQSASSIILHKMGITTAGETEDFLAYKDTGYNPKKILFFVGGIG